MATITSSLPGAENLTTIPPVIPSNDTNNDNEEKFHPAIQYLFISYYAIVFFSGLIGNVIIISAVYKFKRMRTVVNTFLVNLAISDVLFVCLSIFDGLSFLYNEWIFGDLMCRLQSTFIEISYTVSICTLTVVAIERYISICHPHKLKRTSKQALKVCAGVWLFAFLFCACLFYGYCVERSDKNVMQCRNDNWSNQSRLSFYVIHSVIVYLIPLTIMCCSHLSISKVLLEQKIKTGLSQTFTAAASRNKRADDTASSEESDLNKITTTKQKVTAKASTASTNNLRLADNITKKQKQNTVNRRMKIVKLLVVVTTIFFVLWTPFILVRLLQYTGVHVNQMLWRASQLLIFGNTAVNCFIYALMSPAFRTSFKGLFTCSKTLTMRMNGINNSKSLDLSETSKNNINHKSLTLARSNQRINKI